MKTPHRNHYDGAFSLATELLTLFIQEREIYYLISTALFMR